VRYEAERPAEVIQSSPNQEAMVDRRQVRWRLAKTQLWRLPIRRLDLGNREL